MDGDALGGVTGILQHCGLGKWACTVRWNIEPDERRGMIGLSLYIRTWESKYRSASWLHELGLVENLL